MSIAGTPEINVSARGAIFVDIANLHCFVVESIMRDWRFRAFESQQDFAVFDFFFFGK